jgi:Subtilase family
MKRFLFFLILMTFIFAAQATAQSRMGFVTLPLNDGSYEFIINIPTNITTAQLNLVNKLKAQFGITTIDKIQTLGFEKWRVPSVLLNGVKSTLQALGFQFETEALFKTVPENSGKILRQATTSSDSTRLRAEMTEAAQWTEFVFFNKKTQKSNYPIRVGVIDGGISLNAQGVPYGDLTYFDATGSRDFTNEIADNALKLNDLGGHGTHTYGTIEKAYQKSGMNTKSKITVLKAFKKDGTANLWHILKAIDHAISLKLHIVSCSFNYYDSNPARTAVVNGVRVKLILEQAINRAKDYNLLVVASAGNQGLDVDKTLYGIGCFPTNFQNENLLIATAYDFSTATRCEYANTGNRSIHIAAPGTVMTRHIGSDTLVYVASGTSFSAPLTAATAAILASAKSDFDWESIKNILLGSLNHNHNNWVGKLNPAGGVLNSIYPATRDLGKLENDLGSDKGNLQVAQIGQTVQITYECHENAPVKVRIVDMMGKIVHEQSGFVNPDVPTIWNWLSEDAQNGMYIIQLQVHDQTVLTQKWVKMQ